MARIKVLERHAAADTIPSGLRIQSVRAKGQDAETLQAKFDDVIREAEQKLLDAVITHLRCNVEESKKAIQEREGDINGTIARWKSYLQESKEISSGQVDSLVEAATKFAVKVSSDSAVACACKALQTEITRKETKKRESMDSSEAFVPTELSIRDIIRQEIHRTQDSATNNHQRKVSFSNSRKSRSTHQQPTKKNSNSVKDRNHRELTRLNGLTALARRQKTPRAKVPAPQNRHSLCSRKMAL